MGQPANRRECGHHALNSRSITACVNNEVAFGGLGARSTDGAVQEHSSRYMKRVSRLLFVGHSKRGSVCHHQRSKPRPQGCKFGHDLT